MMAGLYKALIVDDEPLARQRIAMLLESEERIEIIGECSNGQEAAEDTMRIRPDLVFLDIQMPRLNGFKIVQAVGPDKMPVIIFVTAYDKHAVRAFEVHAVDYLLKPFDQKRFDAALKKAIREIGHRRKSTVQSIKSVA